MRRPLPRVGTRGLGSLAPRGPSSGTRWGRVSVLLPKVSVHLLAEITASKAGDRSNCGQGSIMVLPCGNNGQCDGAVSQVALDVVRILVGDFRLHVARNGIGIATNANGERIIAAKHVDP